MSTRINTNTTAFNAALNLTNNSNKLSTDIQRLSSGLRINSAADDAAGLVISESLQAQSNGLTQATNNTNDAINVVKTAEGALNEVQSLLINIRQTIVQAANVGSNNSTALQADKDSVAAAVSSIDRIASTTQFNGKNLLDGSANSGGAAFTAGSGTAVAAVGSSLSVSGQAGAYGATGVASGNVGFTAGTADVEKAVFSAGTAADTFGGSFTIEGKTVNLSGTSNTTANIATAIQQQTGLNYSVTGSALTATGLSFTNTKTGAPAAAASFTGLQSYTAGTSTASTVTSTNPTAGANAHVTVNGQSSDTVSADGTTYSFSSGALKGLALTTNATATNANIGTFSASADTSKAGNNLQFQIGANQNQFVSVSINSQKSNNIGSVGGNKLSDLLAGGGLDLTDATGASQQKALAVVDQAIADISSTREKLGSTQTNVLESNLNSLGVAQQNTDASVSTIRDTDLSAQIVDYTKNQILVQAGTSALSYANQAPQAILKLLQ